MERSRTGIPLVGLALALGSIACEELPTLPEPVSVEDTEFAPELGIDLDEMTRLESGVYVDDLVVGDGEGAMKGDSVTVHYKLWLHDGTLIHDTEATEDGVPAKFLLREGAIIGGWVDGVPGMRVGGTRKLVIPWQRAYGAQTVKDAQGVVVIPPYSNLVFEVELLDTVHLEDDGSSLPEPQ
ncbi:MAG TPA: FKBP-type peptidyl-prolyl cis-trans isomerase [Longimicrobiales bacterium]